MCTFSVAILARDTADAGNAKVAKPVSALPSPQIGVNGSGESAGGTPLSSSSDLAELPDDQLWEAFFGKMANKGELPGLGREEQIVVKQQMLDRLMQLERELQERSLMVNYFNSLQDFLIVNCCMLLTHSHVECEQIILCIKTVMQTS